MRKVAIKSTFLYYSFWLKNRTFLPGIGCFARGSKRTRGFRRHQTAFTNALHVQTTRRWCGRDVCRQYSSYPVPLAMGWEMTQESELKPFLMTQEAAPDGLVELTVCTCKKISLQIQPSVHLSKLRDALH